MNKNEIPYYLKSFENYLMLNYADKEKFSTLRADFHDVYRVVNLYWESLKSKVEFWALL